MKTMKRNRKKKPTLSVTYCSNGKRWEELTPEEWLIYGDEYTKAKKQDYRRNYLLKDIISYLLSLTLLLQGVLLILSAISMRS